MDPTASARLAAEAGAASVAPPASEGALRLRLLRNPSILLSSLGINLMSLALPLVLLQVYQRIIPNAALDTFAYLLGGMAAAVVLDGLLRAARSYVIAWQGSRFEHLLGRAAVAHLTEAPMHVFNEDPVGRHLERLQAIDIVRDFYGGSGLVNLLEAPFVLLFLAMVFAISGPLGFVPFGLFILCGASAYWIGRRVRVQIERRNKVDIQRFNFILEVLNGLTHVKSQALESFMQRRYERLQGACAAENGALARLSAMSHSCGAFFSYFVLFATAAAGAYMVLDGDLSQGALAAASLLAGRATQPFIRSMAFWTEYQTVSVARRNLDAIFAYEPESAGYGARAHRVEGRIDLDKVTKAYDGGRPVLDEVSLAIEPGECVLIDGAIGSGKSTLLRLIAGLSRPTSGAIAFDGVGIEELQPARLRREVAYLPEHAVLFRGTILDNLTLFQPEKHLERAMELAAALRLDHAIAKLPEGFETEVGDDLADLLPLGIRQQIGIVRALAADPKIILFDQPNGGLDLEADQRLVELIAGMKGRATVVMVTPRGSYRRLADRVVVLGRAGGGALHATLPSAARDKIRIANPKLRIRPEPQAEGGPVADGAAGAGPIGKAV